MSKKERLNQALASMVGNEMNGWEREELAEKLAGAPEDIVKEIMRSLPVVWPVSYALFLSFVDQAIRAGACLKPAQYKDWVKAILDVYEAEGLRQAQLFMEGVEDNYVCQIQGEGGLRLDECEAKLLHYARSILGRDLKFVPNGEVSFDTQTLKLPSELNDFDSPAKNFLLYKFAVTFQLQLDLLGTYRFPVEAFELLDTPEGPLQQYSDFFKRFDNPRLAQDLFFLAEALRILAVLQRDYPGLMRDVQVIFATGAIHKTPACDQNNFVAAIEQWLLACIGSSRLSTINDDFILHGAMMHHYLHAESVLDSLQCVQLFYDACRNLPGEYSAELQLPFLGKLCFAEAEVQSGQRHAALKETFMNAFGAQIHDELQKTSDKEENLPVSATSVQEKGVGTLLAMAAASEDIDEEIRPDQEVFRLGTMEVDFSDELLSLARQVFKEFGKIPGDFIAGAIGRAGDLFDAGPDAAVEEENAQPVVDGAMIYDEWDYRRAGYRKNWCRVIIKEVLPIGGTFVDATLRKYKGLLITLRRQFEMMSVQEKFEKRQREGDEIDLDAVIDSVSDTRAGLPPSERLFVRLQRNDRQIAVLFLVDMSSSTEGWVSTALKEALILMSESLAVLGDRYAIYGFSGMRRTRSELFAVKDFDESYGEAVKNKIAAISPKEYTRMAPAIRHASDILDKTEAKIRLLITLSDGKPEDYDGYKGTYAIEDTRHALIEAKNKGIHPFCITVDQEAHVYMDHMYGEVNYVFIDKVVKLPSRIPEIYRNLMT